MTSRRREVACDRADVSPVSQSPSQRSARSARRSNISCIYFCKRSISGAKITKTAQLAAFNLVSPSALPETVRLAGIAAEQGLICDLTLQLIKPITDVLERQSPARLLATAAGGQTVGTVQAQSWEMVEDADSSRKLSSQSSPSTGATTVEWREGLLDKVSWTV